jgi:hypothetical protein
MTRRPLGVVIGGGGRNDDRSCALRRMRRRAAGRAGRAGLHVLHEGRLPGQAPPWTGGHDDRREQERRHGRRRGCWRDPQARRSGGTRPEGYRFGLGLPAAAHRTPPGPAHPATAPTASATCTSVDGGAGAAGPSLLRHGPQPPADRRASPRERTATRDHRITGGPHSLRAPSLTFTGQDRWLPRARPTVGAAPFDQAGNRGERAAADGLSGDDAEPDLDPVDPR